MKILIIEDEFSYQQVLKQFLMLRGYQVITANDGTEGLSLAKSQQPDLILLDISMPNINGMQVLTEIRKDDYGKTVKIILLTNLEPNDEMIRDVVTGKPAYYLIKANTSLEELLKKIESLFPKKINEIINP